MSENPQDNVDGGEELDIPLNDEVSVEPATEDGFVVDDSDEHEAMSQEENQDLADDDSGDTTDDSLDPQDSESVDTADGQADEEDQAADSDADDADEKELSDEEVEQLVLPDDLDVRVEAAILTADRPLSAARLAKALQLRGAGRPIRKAIRELNDHYAMTDRSFRIEEVAGAFQFMTLPVYADVLDGLKRKAATPKLTVAAIETLSIVAYRQPIIRSDIETVRGVACGEVLKTLIDHHLVKPVGRAEKIGRPVLYGTTKNFLEVFGLSSIKDLPKVDQLQPPSL